MFNNILVAIDGSKHAHRAAERAVELIKYLPNVSVTLFHVSTTVNKSELLRSHFDVKKMLEESAHKELVRTELLFKNQGIPYQLEVSLGDPGDEIIAKLNESNYDLVIVGSRGLSKFQEFVLGSVSNRVAHEATCPILIIK